MLHEKHKRNPDHDIDLQFIDRWSPRAFSGKPVPEEVLFQLFEAARWAPSCYNEQPWRFLYARTEEDLAAFRELLLDSNREWAEKAPVLMFLVTKKHFTRNNKKNRYATFDAGAAWVSLALQARKLGLFTHAMAGIHRERVYEYFGIDPELFTVICAIAAGYYGNPEALPPKHRKNERPNSRKPIESSVFEGKSHTDS